MSNTKSDDAEVAAGTENLKEGAATASVQPEPTLASFLTTPKPKVSAFFKALKVAKKRKFEAADERSALDLLRASETGADLLWLMASQTTLPEPVEAWIWTSIQELLRHEVGDNFDPASTDREEILQSLLNWLSAQLEVKNPKHRKRAETWFRLGVLWLATKRALDPWILTEKAQPLFFKKSAEASRRALAAIQKGKGQEFRLAVAVSGLAYATVAASKKETDSERVVSSRLRSELEVVRTSFEKAREENADLNVRLDQALEAERATRNELENLRRHSGHELAQVKAGHRVLLTQKFSQLLSSAVDALEIDPPAPEIALSRIKAVLKRISEELE